MRSQKDKWKEKLYLRFKRLERCLACAFINNKIFSKGTLRLKAKQQCKPFESNQQ